MKKLSSLGIIALVFFTLTAAFTTTGTNDFKMDTEKSKLTWKGYKVLGQHEGNISLKEGALSFKEGKLTGGSFTIDMTSITCTDIEDKGTAAKLVGHLSSDDFFGVEAHPTAQLDIKKTVSYGKKDEGYELYKIVADLTIKGTTKEIKFNAHVFPASKDMVSAKAMLEIDRTDFGLRYGSGSFLENLGDNTIYDEFEIEVVLVGNKDMKLKSASQPMKKAKEAVKEGQN